MMKNLLFILLSIQLIVEVSAQNTDTCDYEMHGIILDADTKEALPFVKITVNGKQRATLTDINGEFYFKQLCSEDPTLIISCYGYCDTTCEHFHQHGKSPHIFIKQQVYDLDEVIIKIKTTKDEGTKSISQETIDKQSLLTEPMQGLGAMVAEVEGVTFTSSGNNVQLPVIHGLYGNRILILNNGIKHGFQNWGIDHAPEIDISAAHSLTVVKGAAGVRYGPEALGGAVIVKPNPLYLNEKLSTRLGTGYQSNGRGYFTNTEINQGFKKWSYSLGANFTQIGDQHSPDYSLSNSGKKERSINGGLRYHLKDWDIKSYYSYINQDLALLRSSIAESGNAFIKAINSTEPSTIQPFSYVINEPKQNTQHHLSKTEINWWYSDDAKLTFKYGRQLNKRQEYDVRRNAHKPIIDLDLITTNYKLEWKHPDWKKLDGLIGIELFTQNNDNNPGTGTTPFIPNYNTRQLSAYVLESFTKNKSTLELGLRLDNNHNNVRGRETNQEIFMDDYSFTNLTSSLGYILQVSDNTTLRSNIGTAWRTPNMAELYSFGQHGFKTSFGLLRYYRNSQGELRTNRVNPLEESNVLPEKGYKWVSELQTQKQSNSFTLTAYTHYIQNFIFEKPTAVVGTIRGPMPVFIFDQTDAIFIGSDITWKKKWSKSLNGTLGLSYLWSKNRRKDEALINQPPITCNYKLAWEKKEFWKLRDSKLALQPSYTVKQFNAPQVITPEQLIDGSVELDSNSEIFDFKEAPEGYFLLNASWSFNWQSFDATISIQNILNTRYRNYLNEMRYFADEPGRNLLIAINYNFKTQTK